MDNRIEGVVITFADVTALKTASEQMRRLATVLIDSNDAVTVLALDGRIESWNRGAERLYGYTQSEAMAMNVVDLTASSHQDETRDFLKRIRRETNIPSWETQRKCKDGEVLDIWVTATTLHDERGRTTAIATTERDITERKRIEREIRQLNQDLEQRVAERTLQLQQANESLLAETAEHRRSKESAARLAAIVESTEDAIVSAALDGTVLSWNAAAERLYEFPAAEVVGKSIFLTMAFKEIEQLEPIRARLLRGDPVGNMVVHRLRRDGTPIWLSLTYSLIRNSAGTIVGFSTIARDVSRQNLMEQALRESRNRLTSIVDTAGEGLITIDEKGIIDTFNKAAEKMFGYNAQEIIGQNIKLLMPAPFKREHDSYIGAYVRTGIPRMIGIGREVVGQRKDGTIFAVDVAVSEFHDGSQRRFTGLVRDISSRKELEKEVLEIAAEEQGRIGRDLHDSVGQELTGLRLMSEDLAESLAEQESSVSTLAARIADGLKHCLTQVQALTRGLVPVDVDAEGLKLVLEDFARHIMTVTGIECSFECEGQCDVEDNFKATHLFRIAQEAVTNALKHSGATGIHIRLTRRDRGLTLTIEDDGIGIDSPNNRATGMGVKIMSYRAGLINAVLSINSSENGKGTIVTCNLMQEGLDNGQKQV